MDEKKRKQKKIKDISFGKYNSVANSCLYLLEEEKKAVICSK